MISRCRCKAVLRPARFSPRKRSSAAACRVPSWRSPHSLPERMPAPGKDHLVICTRSARSGRGSTGRMPRSRSSRTPVARSETGRQPVEKRNDPIISAAGGIVVTPMRERGRNGRRDDTRGSLRSKVLFPQVQASRRGRAYHDPGLIELAWTRREVAMSALDHSLLDARTASLSRTVWISFASACLAWMFDAMDLTIFTLVVFPSVSDLTGSRDPESVAYAGGLIFAGKLLAWGLAGIAFGVVADRIGRAK